MVCLLWRAQFSWRDKVESVQKRVWARSWAAWTEKLVILSIAWVLLLLRDSLNLEVQPMYARYVIHLMSKSCYIYPDCNSLNDTCIKGRRSIYYMNGWTLILWNGLFSRLRSLMNPSSSAGFSGKRSKQPPKAMKNRSQQTHVTEIWDTQNAQGETCHRQVW